VYLLNRALLTKKKTATPYELWWGKKPDLSHTRAFGTETYAHIDKQLRKKLDPKAKKLILVEYQVNSTNYRLYDPSTDKVTVSRNVVFNDISESNTNPGIRLPRASQAQNGNVERSEAAQDDAISQSDEKPVEVIDT